MNLEAEQRRVVEGVELDLLVGCMRDAETWNVVDHRSITDEHFASPVARRLFRALAEHYRHEQTAPESIGALVLRGLPAEDVRQLDDTIGCGSLHAEVLARAVLDAAAERSRQIKVKYARAALAEGDAQRARELLEDAKRESSTIEWLTPASIFAPLPVAPWKVRDLHIGPGRPTLIAGYGSSAKTLCVQSLALCVAAGRQVWGAFDVAAANVRHLDFEQGRYATCRRYQRLALGHAITPEALADRLLVSVLPRLKLDSAGALDAFMRVAEGADLVVVDSLKAATPSLEENDSKIRVVLDILTQVSERTGAAFVVIHHAVKPREGQSDKRALLRGSSAIFDSAGCVLLLTAGKTPADPRRVAQVKTPAEREGGSLQDFELVVEDVPLDGDPTAGVNVRYQQLTASADSASAQAGAAALDRAQRILELVRSRPGCSKRYLREHAGFAATRVDGAIELLIEDGRLAETPGARGAKGYRLEVPHA